LNKVKPPRVAAAEERPEDLGLASSGTRFQCTLCGECCGLEVFLTSADIERIRRRREAKASIGVLYQTRSTLAACKDKAACYFLKGNRCGIYSSRPLQCRLYPFFPIRAKELGAIGMTVPSDVLRITREGDEYYISIAQYCPGLGRGPTPVWSDVISTWLQHIEEGGGGK
jgi:Fe-S-cluster containining protein